LVVVEVVLMMGNGKISIESAFYIVDLSALCCAGLVFPLSSTALWLDAKKFPGIECAVLVVEYSVMVAAKLQWVNK